MTERIKQYIELLEKEKNIKVLLASETGSRAWGFPSPDSDYDVRLIYKHECDWYLRLDEAKDTIELMLDNNEIDISGWDIKKCLHLLLKSNPPFLERIQSSIIYKVDTEFLTEIKRLATHSYSRIATIHHYLSMAKKCLDEISESNEFKLKKFFYAMRASVACKWILDKEEMPPIFFPEMLEKLDITSELKNRIYELIKLKETASESYFHTGEKALFSFMQECVERAGNEAATLPSSKAKMVDFNDFFRKTVK